MQKYVNIVILIQHKDKVVYEKNSLYNNGFMVLCMWYTGTGNTSWHLKEPSNPNVDTYFEFSDRVLTNVSDAHYADTKFRKGLKKKYTNKYLYYIANQIPSSFDGKKVGQSGQGTYIIQELDGEFFWFQILQFSSSELKVKTKFGQTFVFEKVWYSDKSWRQ